MVNEIDNNMELKRDFESFLSSVIYEMMEICTDMSQKEKESLFSKYKEIVLEFCLLSLSSTQYYLCRLPHNNGHKFRIGLRCTMDESHKFCRSHNLKKCPICGHDLEPIPPKKI